MILTDQEIQAAYMTADSAELFARAIEQAVITKLAQGVRVEPLFWVYEAGTPDGYFYFYEVDRTRKDGNYRDKKCWKESPVFTELQLAAARVQALEEAAKVCDQVQWEHGQYTFSARMSAERIRNLK